MKGQAVEHSWKAEVRTETRCGAGGTVSGVNSNTNGVPPRAGTSMKPLLRLRLAGVEVSGFLYLESSATSLQPAAGRAASFLFSVVQNFLCYLRIHSAHNFIAQSF